MISCDYPECILENLEPYSSDNEEPDAKEELMEEIKSLKGLFNGLINISTKLPHLYIRGLLVKVQ
jgi:hypothetical protein